MSLHLITGYAGSEHITSKDQGAYNIATFGGGNFVLDRGAKFAATVTSNNNVSVSDGEAMLQGRFIKMPTGTTESVSIDNGTQGKNRNDLICIRYEKNASDSTESASLVVIKGTESTGTAADPTYNEGSITDGNATIADFPIYRVKLNGINIESLTALFSVKVSMATYMDNYQLPVATTGRLGGVKIGSGITVASNGTISVPELQPANATTLGGVKVRNNGSDGVKIDSGIIKADTGGSIASGNTKLLTGGDIYNELQSGKVGKLGTNTVGSSSQGIYLNQGIPTQCMKLKNKNVSLVMAETVSVPANGSNTVQFSDSALGVSNIVTVIPCFAVSSNNKMLEMYIDGDPTAGTFWLTFKNTTGSTVTVNTIQFNVLYWSAN